MRRRILIKESDWNAISRAFDAEERETAAYALIGVSKTRSQTDFMVREVFFLNENDYQDRTRIHLLIAPSFINSMARRCELQGLGLLAMHSHPMQDQAVQFSMSDDWGEERELQVFHDLGDGRWPLVSLVRGMEAVQAREWTFVGQAGSHERVDDLVIVGDHWTRTPMGASSRVRTQKSEMHERQVLALGLRGQRDLQQATMAIVGVGGTGSACAEMLVRLGIGKLILIDDDKLENTNISRVFGSTLGDIGKAKVHVLKKWLTRINPKVDIDAHPVNLVGNTHLLKEADVVLGCTDTETSRALANQFACQYMRPLIDMGNRIDASEGKIRAASARMTFVAPGGPCMECFGNINHSTVQAENMSGKEYERLREEGYVVGLDEKAPSVISLNLLVASLAITKLLDVLTGVGGLPHAKYTFSYLDGELRAARVQRRTKCICRHYEAYGDLRQLEPGKK
jgi:molybdopterin/thiamine biosynthesis adenylyltransferase